MEFSDRVMSALRWATVARIGAQIISWCATIVVIRLLTPEDYGMMAMVAVVMAVLIFLNTFGQDAVLVRQPNLTERQRQQIFGIVTVVNLAFFVVLELLAERIAEFYNEPRLTPLVQVMAFQFVILIFETLPLARLERELRFKGRSIVDLATAVVASISTLAMALAGWGVWALAWGSLITTATRTLGLYIVSPSLVWPRFSLDGMRKNLSFGGYVSADRGLWFAYSESDKFIGGKIMGTEPLGIYAVACHLASLPINKLNGIINAVAFPAFSYADANTEKVGEYLVKATRLLALVAFPVFFGMSSVAPELVLLLLEEKWSEAIIPLQLLSLIMPLRMLGNVFSPMLFGIGRPEISALNNAIAALILPVAFVFAASGGTTALSMAWLLIFPLLFLVFAHNSCRHVGVSLVEYFRQLIRPLAISAVMYVAVTLARPFMLGDSGELVHLLQLIAIGVATYIATLYVVHRSGLDEIRQFMRRGAKVG